jgi:hypothetical protein
MSGDAKGALGVVCGTHGGVEHLMVDFPADVMELLAIGEKIQVRAFGAGLELKECPEVTVMSADPGFIDRWPLGVRKGKLAVPVTHVLPAKLMGSGLGSVSCYSGDYDIQLFDQTTVKQHRLSTLRFGDLVAITDADHTFGRRYLGGAVSVGVIVHSRSDMSGHGPGVTTLLTSSKGAIEPVIDENANIGFYLKIGRWRPGRPAARRKGRK